jgi:hypothetical protein
LRPSLRFLALVVFGWAGVRAATLGVIPGAALFRVEPSEAKAPPITATQFPPIEPLQPTPPMLSTADAPTEQPVAVVPTVIRYVQSVVGVPVAMRPGVVTVYQLPPANTAASADLPPRPTRLANAMPTPQPALYSLLPPLDENLLSRVSGLSAPASRPAAFVPGQSVPVLDPHRIDRWQVSTWALLRSQQTGVAGSPSLASSGQLGASQAGARLVWNFNRQLALTARMSSEVGRRGGEIAGGVRVQPLASIPIWLTAERRQAIGRYGGGRSAFALFLEGGLYQRPLPWRFSLDAYLQGGVVGLRSRDLFVDGGLAVTRPLFRQFSAGFGLWGGAQPGIYRVDAGPRLTMRVRNNLRVHVDWRQRLAGNARPGSGPALTLAGDF